MTFCWECGDPPTWATSLTPLSEGHASERFPEARMADAYLDGVKQRRAVEAIAGDPGAVIRRPSTKREDPCPRRGCTGFMVEEVQGNVRVEWFHFTDSRTTHAGLRTECQEGCPIDEGAGDT